MLGHEQCQRARGAVSGDVDPVGVDIRHFGQDEIQRHLGVGQPGVGRAELARPFQDGRVRRPVGNVAVDFEGRDREAGLGVREMLGAVALAQVHACKQRAARRRHQHQGQLVGGLLGLVVPNLHRHALAVDGRLLELDAGLDRPGRAQFGKRDRLRCRSRLLARVAGLGRRRLLFAAAQTGALFSRRAHRARPPQG